MYGGTEHQPGDSWSNDGWMANLTEAEETNFTGVGQQHKLFTHFWCVLCVAVIHETHEFIILQQTAALNFFL